MSAGNYHLGGEGYQDLPPAYSEIEGGGEPLPPGGAARAELGQEPLAIRVQPTVAVPIIRQAAPAVAIVRSRQSPAIEKHYDFFGVAKNATEKRRETFRKWFWNRLWFLLGLVGMAAGAYLSFLLVPLIVNALLAAGFAPWIALPLGIMAGLGLVFGTMAITMPSLLAINRLFFLREGMKQDRERASFSSVFDYFSLLGGAGFGIYLCVMFTPLLINGLLPLGIPYWLALGVGVVASLVFIDCTMNLFSLWRVLKTTYREYLNFDGLGSRSALSLPWLLGGFAGLGAGIYLSALVGPVIISSLLGLGIAYPYAWFIALAISLALIASSARLACIACVSLVGLIQYSKLSAQYSMEGSIEQKNWLNFERTVILQSLAKTVCPSFVLAINNNIAPPVPTPRGAGMEVHG